MLNKHSQASLAILGGQLEPIIAQFRKELAAAGVRHPEPHFYLSDEWGVLWADEDGTPIEPPSRSIAIPFYLADAGLARREWRRAGWDRGYTRGEILQLLRHEMGHVLNYAYRLYADPAWTAHFGDFWLEYPDDDYPFDPASRDFVRHLPWPEGYAQKHPDEDWAETFAVWVTPRRNWRRKYAKWPGALAKLLYCDRVMGELALRKKPKTRRVKKSEEYTCVPEDYYDRSGRQE